MSELISHTPTWVLVVFVILIILGFIQGKKRTVNVNTVLILPISMIVFSLFGVLSAFGLSTLTLSLWGIGLIITLIVGIKLAYPKLVRFSKQTNKLIIPGSWVPLFFMMSIFCTKYFIGFAVARELPIINEQTFIILLSLLYGAFSGIFLSRAIIILRASK